MRSRRCLLLAAALAAVGAVTACQSPGWPPDPVSKPSEVSGRIWYCTPGSENGQPGDDKASESAVKLEIVTADDGPEADRGRFAPNTVLGQATAEPGEVWRTGSVHEVSVAWRQPDITRSDLMSSSLRVRVTRSTTGPRLFQAADRWVFSLFISLDVVTGNDSGEPEIDWHRAVTSTGEYAADHDEQTVVDTPFSDLRGWPRPCPKA